MKTDRNDRYPRAASVLHAFADPPYGFYIFNASARRAAMRPCCTGTGPLCAPLDGCRGFAPLLRWFARQLSKVKSNPTCCEAALLAARCSMLRARCSMLDRYHFPVRKKRAWWGSASSGAAAPRIKMLGADRLNTDPRRREVLGGRHGREEGGSKTWWSLIGVTLQSHQLWGDRRLQ